MVSHAAERDQAMGDVLPVVWVNLVPIGWRNSFESGGKSACVCLDYALARFETLA